MTEEIRIREIDVVLTKVSIAPSDVLVVSMPVGMRTSIETQRNISDSFEQAFGVPALVLTDGLKLECVLSISPESLALAKQKAEQASEAIREQWRKQYEGLCSLHSVPVGSEFAGEGK